MAERKRVDVSTLRHHTLRDLELAAEARRQFEETQEPERLRLAIFYAEAALETISKRIERLMR